MRSKFKEGDKVVCVSKGPPFNNIEIGKLYTILKKYPEHVLIKDDSGRTDQYFSERFRLATLLERELAE